LAQRRVVAFGEAHDQDNIIAVQADLLKKMAQESYVYVVMEHFSFEMQELLGMFQKGMITRD
jgi:uncharacterized iron-regulated protein